MATNSLSETKVSNDEENTESGQTRSLHPSCDGKTQFCNDDHASPKSTSEREYSSLPPNTSEASSEIYHTSEQQMDHLPSSEEEIVEILREAKDDISLEDFTPNRRQRSFNLLEYSPDVLKNFRLTPKSSRDVMPQCSVEFRKSMDHPIFKEPLPFIYSEESGEFQLNQKTLQLLDSLDTPLVVIGITGSYRSGKSYLMNYLAGRESGFQVGNTVESCTRGIWIWCQPHPLLPDTTLVWMDSEGLDDPEKGDCNFDMQVIVLALLLSSTFIYNTQGRIDNSLVKQLGFVSDLTNHLQVRAGQMNENGDDFDLYFPNLFVVVRDFFLELKTRSATITADEYFEQCLKVREASSKSQGRQVKDYNEPRIKIRKFFPSSKRYCRTLSNPRKSNYRNGLLDYILGTSKDDLNPDFWVQAKELKELLINISPQKTFGQCDKVTGRMFGMMAQCYIAAIQQGEIPCIQSALQLTAMQENRRILELALDEYRSCMLILPMPLDQDQLYQHHQNLMRDLLEKYRKKIIFEEAHDFRQEYDDRVVAAYNEIAALNETKSIQFCESLLEKLNEAIATKFRTGKYLCSGGYAIYKEDLQLLTEQYNSTPNKGVKSDGVLHKFLHHKESEIGTIVAIDKEMSIIRVQEEAEKRQKVEIELREKMLKDEVCRARECEGQLRKSLMVSKGKAVCDQHKKKPQCSKKRPVAKKAKNSENQETLQKEMERRLNEQQRSFEQLMKEREDNHERLVNELRIEIGKLKSNPVRRVINRITPANRCTVM